MFMTMLETTTSTSDSMMNNGYDVYRPTPWIFVGVYIVSVTMVSVLANLVVLSVMLARHLCLNKKFKATHLFMCSLAVSDICFSISIHPMLAATSFGVDVDHVFSKGGCDWYGFGAIFFGCFCMLIHGSCSFSRYKTILHPHQAVWQEFPFNVSLLLLDLLIAFGFAIAPVLGWGRYETFEFGCTVAFHDGSTAVRSYVVSLLLTVLCIPLCVCCYCYGRITVLAFDSKLTLLTMKTEDEEKKEENLEEKEKLEEKRANVSFRRPPLLTSISMLDRRLTRLTFLTAASYIVVWMPFAILSLWETFLPPTLIPSGYRVVSSLFCKSATALNPFIYFFMSAGFRDDLIFCLRRLRSSLLSPSAIKGTRSSSSSSSSSQQPTTFMSSSGPTAVVLVVRKESRGEEAVFQIRKIVNEADIIKDNKDNDKDLVRQNSRMLPKFRPSTSL